MNGTPRLRSSYPSSPGSGQKSPASQDAPKVKSPLPNLPESPPASSQSNAPLIPVNLVDAPSQRMYAAAVYVLLLVWCLYDWWRLVEDDSHSIGLFVKWTCIHSIFIYGIPQLRIPWLEWSEWTSHFALLIHAIINGILMFRIPVRRLFYALVVIELTEC
jgi:nucleoporin POM152